MDVLIPAATLAQLMEKGQRVVLLDVRWSPDGADGHAEYRAAHIPGAVYVDLATELAGPGRTGGRGPLPDAGAFSESARRWGVRSSDLVVAYDDAGNVAAGRARWLLRHAGHAAVQLLDGGFGAWRAAGYPTDHGEEQSCLGDVELRWELSRPS